MVEGYQAVDEPEREAARRSAGHKGQRRKPVPPEDVNEVKTVEPDECRECCAPLDGNDPSPRIHQVADIPPITPHVLEHQLHELECSTCGTSTRASLPEDGLAEAHADAMASVAQSEVKHLDETSWTESNESAWV